MKTADEILDEELNEVMLEYLKDNQVFREWIKDAMYSYAKLYHDSEVKRLNLHAVSKTTGKLYCECEIKGNTFQLDNGTICCCKCENERVK